MKTIEPLIAVAIYLRGDQLKPDYVTETLGIEPSSSQKKGNMRPGKKPTIAKIGVWEITAQTDSRLVTDHVDELLIKLGMTQTPLNRIDGVEEAYLDIFMGTDDEGGTYRTLEFRLSKKHMDEINRLGLSIQFTVS